MKSRVIPSQSMQQRSWRSACAIAFLMLAALALQSCTLWTVRPIEDPDAAPAQGIEPGVAGFSAAAYIDSIWDTQVAATVEAEAVDLQTLLDALAADPEAAQAEYGYREGTRPYNFLVKGEAIVLAVDSSSRTGTLSIDLLPGDGEEDALIQVGPVIRGTALRDALPFIQFNMFINQLEYAAVSNEMHAHMLEAVIAPIDIASLQGKTISFSGAFTYDAGGDVRITPFQLQEAGS